MVSSLASLSWTRESTACEADTQVARRRMFTYICLTVALVAVYVPLTRSAWKGSADLHTIVETLGTLMAAMVGVLALARFYARKNNHILYIGTAFLGTAFLDGYHTVVTSSLFCSLFSLPPPSLMLIPWSWTVSRTFLAVVMCLSWWVWRGETKLESGAQHKEYVVYAVVGALTLFSFGVFAFVPLPGAYYPGSIFGRPEEFIAGTLFAIALITYLRRGAWRSDAFEHWCVVSLILSLFSQAVVMSRSFGLFDAMFDLAHLLKVASYSCVFVGLLVNQFQIFRKSEVSALEAERVALKLTESISKRDTVGRHLNATNTELKKRATELQTSRMTALHVMRDIAERESELHETNQQLREQKEYVNNIFGAMIDMLLVVAPDGSIATVNDATCNLLGYQEEELIGRPARLLFSEEEADSAKSFLSSKALPVKGRVLRTLIDVGHVSDVECWYAAKDGNKIPVTLSGSVMRNGEGQIQGILCVAQDTTDRMKQEEEFRLQSAALESAANAILISDRGGRIIWANRAFSQLTGYSIEEAVGVHTRVLKSGQHDAAFFADVWRTVLAGQTWHGEMVNRRKQGGLYTEYQTITPVTDEHGEITHFVAVKQDITERKQADMKILESERQYRTLFEGSADAIMLLDETAFFDCNAATLAIFGLTNKQELISLHPSELSPPIQPDGVDSVTKADAMIATAFKEGTTKFKWTHRRANGEDFSAEVCLTAIILGDRRALQATVRDVSRQEQLQCELAQAQKLESVGQLAAGMAHEINTPTQYVGDNTRFLKDGFGDLCTALDSLQKLLQAAKEGTVEQQIVAEVEATLKQADVEYLREEIPQAIDQSLDGIERVAKIVRAMKTFSHPGGQEKSLVNLTEAIETTITVARNEWKYVAEMVTEFEPELPQVSCLPGELNQVFLNLIINAAHAIGDALGDDATDKGTITVGTRRNGEWAEIFVRDTGTGIPEHVRTRIFDPFFTTKEVGKGTGQGLAIARSVVVDKHGGTLECETEQGKGTTFFVRLPIDAERQSQGAENEYEDAGSLC
jgi:PAS domain S-box-containing protein